MSQAPYASVLDRPIPASAGGGQFSGAGWPGGPIEPVPYSPFALPFAGWMALSDIVANLNPALGDAMRAMALVLQAAVEQSTAELFPQIRALLADAGIPRWSIDDAERSLLSGLLPLSVADLAQDAGQAFAELAETGTVEPTEPAQTGFLAAVMHYGGHGVLGLGGGQLAPAPRLPVSRPDLPDGFLDYFLPPTPLRVVASLDLRPVASGADFSVWRRRPLRRQDALEATENTYIDRDVTGLANPVFIGDSVTGQYRADIDDWLPANFTESISLGRPVDQYYYIYELTNPKRSRAIRKLRSVMKGNGDKIRDLVSSSADIAVGVAAAAAGPAGVPVAAIGGLVSVAGRMALNSIQARLVRSLEDTSMTPWGITHTTLCLPEYPVGPLSVFILWSPAAPAAKLHRIRRADVNPNESVMDLDYGGENVRALQRGRGMMGLSNHPARPCPADLWAQVAQRGHPAAWTEPTLERAGFRVLVPHAEAGADQASYVSALRADVLPAQ
jgi:hypothetical protein